MDDKRGGRGPKGFGGKKSGGFGERKSFGGKGKPGGYDRKPRAAGERSERPARPYAKREEGGFSGERKAYGERKPRAYGERSERPARPYAKREEGGFSGERKAYGERKPRAYGERSERPARPYAKREEGGFSGERKAYGERKPRAYGERSERPSRPYAKREEGGFGGERKTFERKPREFGERKPREFDREFGEKKFEKRGEGPSAKFSGKRSIKRERTPQEAGAGDGWLAGYHAVMAALNAGRRKVRTIWLLAEAKGELAELLEKHPEWPVEIKAKPDFENEFGDMVHQGVAVLVGNLPQPSIQEVLASKPKLIVALDQVTDPHNLGAIVRSCAAFGAAAVLVTEHRAAGMGPTAAKVAAGAMETVPVVEIVNLVQTLEMMKDNGFRVAGLAGEATEDIADFREKGPLCLVVGSEGDGLRRLTRENCDVLLKINIAPAIESLNVSVATGIALNLLGKR